jgi:hypothetical protein
MPRRRFQIPPVFSLKVLAVLLIHSFIFLCCPTTVRVVKAAAFPVGSPFCSRGAKRLALLPLSPVLHSRRVGCGFTGSRVCLLSPHHCGFPGCRCWDRARRKGVQPKKRPSGPGVIRTVKLMSCIPL